MMTAVSKAEVMSNGFHIHWHSHFHTFASAFGDPGINLNQFDT